MADNKELKIELGRDCVVVTPGYNGKRHNDEWVKHDLPFGITAWAYPDGELISVQVSTNDGNRPLETFSFQGWTPASITGSKP